MKQFERPEDAGRASGPLPTPNQDAQPPTVAIDTAVIGPPDTSIEALPQSIHCDLDAPPQDADPQVPALHSTRAPVNIPPHLRKLFVRRRNHLLGDKHADYLDQGARTRTERIRLKLDEGRRADTGKPSDAIEREIIHIYSRSELASLAPPEYLVDPLLPKMGLVCLAGASGLGKTFIAVDIACSVATGREFLGLPTEDGAVIYVAAEGSAGLNPRITAWEKQRGARVRDDRLGMVKQAVSLNGREVEHLHDAIGKFVGRHGPVSLVVIDTLARCLSGSEIEERDLKAFINGATSLIGRFGCSVLIVHHPAKAKEESGGANAFRGHSSLFAALDSGLVLRRHKHLSGVVTLEHEKSKDDEPAKTIALAPKTIDLAGLVPPRRSGKTQTSLVFDPIDASVTVAPSKRGRRVSVEGEAAETIILARLEESGSTTAELVAAVAAALGSPASARSLVKSTTDRLIEQGRIERVDKGRYALSATDSNDMPAHDEMS